MVLMEWKDSYSVGVDALDTDHMRLIAIINKVEAADRAGNSVQWALEELRNYAEFHFKAEEARMKAAGYPDIEEHMREHAAFVEWLVTVERTYNLTPEAHFHIAETVNEYLRDWLTHHILLIDMQYKGRLDGMPDGAPALHE